MNFEKYYIADSNNKSNCIVRSLCKVLEKDYDVINDGLHDMGERFELPFNDVYVFEAYMRKNEIFKVKSDKDIKLSKLKLSDGKYAVYCWNKKDYYHMVSVVDGIIYDKNDECLDLYVISVYKLDKKESKRRFIVLDCIIILILAFVVSFGYGVQKMKIKQNNNKDNNDVVATISDDDIKEPEKEEEIPTNTSIKIDDNKTWVYDANYYIETRVDSYYGYEDHSKLVLSKDIKMPYLNINTEDAKIVNQTLYSVYEDLIRTFNKYSEDEIGVIYVDYKTYINDEILSIVVKTELNESGIPVYEYYTYNFNLLTGKILKYNDLYTLKGYRLDTINDEVLESITTYIQNEDIKSSQTYINQSFENYKLSLEGNNINYYLDNKGKLNVVVAIMLPTSSSNIKKNIVLD